MDKGKLRKGLKKRLLEMTEQQRSVKSEKACRNLIATAQFQDAAVVMMYLAFAQEADTSEAILSAWQMGKIVAVPRVDWRQRAMTAVQINSLETGFSTEVCGLRNPIKGLAVPPEQIELVVTPALGFDKKGNRIGRGGAYYDRFFADKKLKAFKCGFAFEEQIVESIPVTETDVPMDLLVTDEQIRYFNNRKGE